MGGLFFAHRHDYSYAGIMRSYEDRMQRLGLTRIDLLLIHDLDHWHHASDARVGAYMSQLPGARYNHATAQPDVLALIETVYRDHRVHLVSAALNFPLGHQAVPSVIPGTLSAKQVKANVAEFETPIPRGFWDDLKIAGNLRASAPMPGTDHRGTDLIPPGPAEHKASPLA